MHALSLLPVAVSHLNSSVHMIWLTGQPGGVDEQFLVVVVAIDGGVGVDDGQVLTPTESCLLRRNTTVIWSQSTRFHFDGDVVILLQIVFIALWVETIVIV